MGNKIEKFFEFHLNGTKYKKNTFIFIEVKEEDLVDFCLNKITECKM